MKNDRKAKYSRLRSLLINFNKTGSTKYFFWQTFTFSLGVLRIYPCFLSKCHNMPKKQPKYNITRLCSRDVNFRSPLTNVDGVQKAEILVKQEQNFSTLRALKKLKTFIIFFPPYNTPFATNISLNILHILFSLLNKICVLTK